MFKRYVGAGIATLLLMLSLGAQALPSAYNISWDGSHGYSLTGMFSYGVTGDRYVTQNDLTSFMFEGFNGSNSLGVFSGIPELFIFDQQDVSVPTLIQAWNITGSGVNFGCLLSACGIGQDGNLALRSLTLLTHIDVSPKIIEGGGNGLSAPTGILALLIGLTAFAFRRRVFN